jgi:hypothetical protein
MILAVSWQCVTNRSVMATDVGALADDVVAAVKGVDMEQRALVAERLGRYFAERLHAAEQAWMRPGSASLPVAVVTPTSDTAGTTRATATGFAVVDGQRVRVPLVSTDGGAWRLDHALMERTLAGSGE